MTTAQEVRDLLHEAETADDSAYDAEAEAESARAEADAAWSAYDEALAKLEEDEEEED